ncbi:LacI family DNA-binding transcriptional regulator [Propioniciclava soli]|uniref:LacI family DNA-binding transcriptional regulator n=1 Tax=Propioniciclava soli TaxID=2775081 RepID=UPI001E5ACBA2
MTQADRARATSNDVAVLAGVSRATVSQVLNGHADRFAPQTAQKVTRAARQLGYQPSAAGRALRRGSSDFVLALIPNTTFGGNLQDWFERLTATLAAQGFTLVLGVTTASVDVLDRLVSQMQPAAVLAFTPFSAAERAVLARNGVVAVDPPSAARAGQDALIGRLQAETLISRGHRRLAFAHLADSRQDPFGAAREDGVRQAALEAGLPDIEVVGLAIHIDEALGALDRLRPPGIAIACYNDDVAISLMNAAQLRGWDVPGDVAVIGMDRTPVSQVTVPRLTTLEYDLSDAAATGAASVLRALGLEGEAPTPSASALRLVEGASV